MLSVSFFLLYLHTDIFLTTLSSALCLMQLLYKYDVFCMNNSYNGEFIMYDFTTYSLHSFFFYFSGSFSRSPFSGLCLQLVPQVSSFLALHLSINRHSLEYLGTCKALPNTCIHLNHMTLLRLKYQVIQNHQGITWITIFSHSANILRTNNSPSSKSIPLSVVLFCISAHPSTQVRNTIRVVVCHSCLLWLPTST